MALHDLHHAGQHARRPDPICSLCRPAAPRTCPECGAALVTERGQVEHPAIGRAFRVVRRRKLPGRFWSCYTCGQCEEA